MITIELLHLRILTQFFITILTLNIIFICMQCGFKILSKVGLYGGSTGLELFSHFGHLQSSLTPELVQIWHQVSDLERIMPIWVPNWSPIWKKITMKTERISLAEEMELTIGTTTDRWMTWNTRPLSCICLRDMALNSEEKNLKGKYS